jgi:2,4-dienoyl-CoA reductase-like NADH-dependent reductase (Old Yellow Enzyme family)
VVLNTPLTIGSMTVRNRLYRAPVLEGAGSGPDAGAVYEKAFVENARAGVGLIIQGSSCIAEEGRTSPGMTLVHERDRVMALEPMVQAVHREGAAIVLQLGHGGLYAMEAWHEPYASQRREPLLAASPVPRMLRPAFRGVPVHVMTTDEVVQMGEQYGRSAAWAREAGYDGVQLGSANAKLLDQFLSPFYNSRTDEFGGSLEKRASVLRVIRQAIATAAGADFPCSVKIPFEDKVPIGQHLTESDGYRLAELAQEWGFDAITPVRVSVFPDTGLCRGGIPESLWKNPSMKRRLETAAPKRSRRAALKAGAWIGGRRYPFEPMWNRDVIRNTKRRVSIPVFAVGGIRTRAEIDDLLESGDADMVGIGRPFYAEGELPARLLAEDAGGAEHHVLCQNSNMCVPAQMLGMKGACYNPEVVKLARRRPER